MSLKQKLKQEASQEEAGEESQKERVSPEIVIHKLNPIHGSESVVLCLPKRQINKLNFKKGQYVKCSIEGKRLIIEKVEV
jgi:hypothetical protein